jgi:hypothetical protein
MENDKTLDANQLLAEYEAVMRKALMQLMDRAPMAMVSIVGDRMPGDAVLRLLMQLWETAAMWGARSVLDSLEQLAFEKGTDRAGWELNIMAPAARALSDESIERLVQMQAIAEALKLD